MRAREILKEYSDFDSSWISDITYDEEQGGVWMSLHTGYGPYFIPAEYDDYERWCEALSKGRFWWSDVKGILTDT